jgi:hypothetical protein
MEKVLTQKLRNWLQRVPHPAKLRTDGGDMLIVKGRNKWHDACQTIEDLGPAVIEALDGDGNVLRTYRVAESDGSEKSASERKTEDATVALSRVMMEVADRAAERSIEAADKAAERNARGYEAAFRALVSVTDLNTKRLAKLESAYFGLVRRHAETIEDTADALADAADASGDGEIKQMALGLLMKGALASQGEKPNGKSKRAKDED